MGATLEQAPDEMIHRSGFAAVRSAVGEKTIELTRAISGGLKDHPELEVRRPDHGQPKRRPGVVLLGSREVKSQPHLQGVGLRQTKKAVTEQLSYLFEPRMVTFTQLNPHKAAGATFFEVNTDDKPEDVTQEGVGSLIDERDDILDVIDELTVARDDPDLTLWNPDWVPAMTLVYAPYSGSDHYGDPVRAQLYKLEKTAHIIQELLPFSVLLDGIHLTPDERPPANI